MCKRFLKYVSLVMILVLSACNSHEDVTSNESDLLDLPDQEGWRSTLTTTSNGKIRARFEYGHMEKYANKKTTKFDQGVQIDLYDREGNHTSKIFAQKATMNDKNSDLELLDSVEVHSDNGLTLFSDKLNWDESSGKIHSDQFVTIVTAEEDSLYGQGFESEQTLENWVIKQPWGVSKKKLNIEAIEKPAGEKNEKK